MLTAPLHEQHKSTVSDVVVTESHHNADSIAMRQEAGKLTFSIVQVHTFPVHAQAGCESAVDAEVYFGSSVDLSAVSGISHLDEHGGWSIEMFDSNTESSSQLSRLAMSTVNGQCVDSSSATLKTKLLYQTT